jgi:hypothetical protein
MMINRNDKILVIYKKQKIKNMKAIKALGTLMVIFLFTMQAKAVVGPNIVVIWPKKSVNTNIIIWSTVQASAQNNATLMATGNFKSEYSSSSNVYTITINQGSFNYTVTQDNISIKVSDSEWPTGDYTGTVTFSSGDTSPFTFTLSN